MSVNHFIQTVWSKIILDNLETKCKLVQNCHRAYEGDCKFARSVKILGVGEPNVRDYKPADSPIIVDAISDEGQELSIDQAKYFAFLVDDVDKAQSVPGLPEEYQRKASHKLAVARDTYIATLIKGVKENVTEVTALTQEAVKEGIDAAIIALRERNFDEDGVIEITPKVYNVFKNCLITLSTDNPDYIKKGKVGTYDGFDVIMTNNLISDGGKSYCAVRGRKAIAFAGQLEKVEAMRSQNYFGDEIRGLDVYGAKVIDKDRIQVVTVPATVTV